MTYTPEQTQEIIARMAELRSYWRRAVEAQITGKAKRHNAELDKSSQEESLQSHTFSE